MRCVVLLVLVLGGCVRAGFDPDRDAASSIDRGPVDSASIDAISMDGIDLDGGSGDLAAWDGRAADLLPAVDGLPPDGGTWTQILRLVPSTTSCATPWAYDATSGGCVIAAPLSCSSDNIAALAFAPNRSYQQIAGTIRGLQFASTDAFAGRSSASIDAAYVDGVSITIGSPRRHVWTFAAGLTLQTGTSACPCHGGDAPPLFVESNWTCDSANPEGQWSNSWYTESPLWDGDAQGSSCAPSSGALSFAVNLPQATSEAIEVRLLADSCDENLAITQLDLYVR